MKSAQSKVQEGKERMNPANVSSEQYDAHMIATRERKRFVVCAANRSRKTGRIVCGARHYDAIMRSHAARKTTWFSRVIDKVLKRPRIASEWLGADQGFIDQCGVWMNRQEAFKVAEAAGQIRYPLDHSYGTLYSENLY